MYFVHPVVGECFFLCLLLIVVPNATSFDVLGCEHEEVLGFQGRMFYLVSGWWCLLTTTMEIRKRSDGNVVVFMALMFLCRFYLFGMSELEWILIHWLNVWRGSCHTMGSWRNSHCGTKKRRTPKKISARWGCFGFLEVRGGRLNFWAPT
jgi:hypothetical protein